LGRLFQQEAKKSEYKYMSEQITAPERPVASGGTKHNYTRAIIHRLHCYSGGGGFLILVPTAKLDFGFNTQILPLFHAI